MIGFRDRTIIDSNSEVNKDFFIQPNLKTNNRR